MYIKNNSTSLKIKQLKVIAVRRISLVQTRCYNVHTNQELLLKGEFNCIDYRIVVKSYFSNGFAVVEYLKKSNKTCHTLRG